MSTLANIRSKIRKLTKRPTDTQMTDVVIDEYINTFILYDFPQEVQTFELTKNVEFCTTPYVDTYSTTEGAYIYNLLDFKNVVVCVDNPVYVAGRQIYLTQSQEEFFNMYPPDKNLGSIGTGDGATVNYVGSLPYKIVHNTVVFGSLNAAGEALVVTDEPAVDAFGREANIGNLRDQANNIIGAVNYITGAYNLTFPAAPALSANISYEVQTFIEDIPSTVLFFENSFKLKPVPDKVYEVKFQVNVVPTELLAVGDSPDIKQWWQYIAYGAAIKILQDNSDFETVQKLLPEFINQQMLVTRKTSRLRSKEQAATIYNMKPVYPNKYLYPW